MDRQSDDFNRHVEAVRMGSIFGRDQKAYAKWSRQSHRITRARSLTGQSLEAAVMGIAAQFPDNVIRGVARG